MPDDPIGNIGAICILGLLAVVVYMILIGGPREKAWRYSICGEGVWYCPELARHRN